MRKILNKCILSCLTLFAAGLAFADINSGDLLVNDDRIFALGNKYTSLVASMYEEETSHIGLKGYHYNLEKHDPQTEQTRLRSIVALQETVDGIDPDSLSAYAKADYYTLKELVGLKVFNAKIKNQFELDPIWYLEPIDGIYELLLKDFLPDQERLGYALKRLEMIPETLQDAEKNITNPPDLTLRLAIEKAKLENKYIPNLTALVLRLSDDKVTKGQINQISQDIQAALGKYETFLKNKLKGKEYSDFRIGEENLQYLYNDIYSVPLKYGKLEGVLEKNLEQAKKALIKDITPKVLAALSDKEKEQRTVKKKVPVFASDYYILAKKYQNAPEYDKVLKAYSAEITKADKFFTTKLLFPTLSLPVTITQAPPILRAEHSAITIYPPVPLADRQSGDILITMPQKGSVDQKTFGAAFNYGKIKFNTAEYITPGKTLIYSVEPANLSLLHKLSNDPFYINGWINYALNTAYENGYFNKDEDKLNMLWFNYTKAVYAMVDYKLQTKELDYTSALAYIGEAGIDAKDAETYLDHLALNPLHAVSYVVGAQEFSRLRDKYKKQLGKKFDMETFHTKILSIGRVPLIAMEDALEKAYAKKEVESYFSMTYF